MKKTVLILMLCLLPLSVQAKSSKLVNTEYGLGGKNACSSHSQCSTGLCKDSKCIYCDDSNPCPAGKTCLLGMCKRSDKCTQTSDCDNGYKCVDGRCQACLSGETGCNCGDAAADGNGGCECVKGTFRYDGECIPYCDYTVCAAGLVKTEKDGMCCCKYGPE